MTAAGTAANAVAARKSQKAMEGAREAERIRQQGFQQESNAAFDESLSKQGADLQKNSIAQAEAERAATMQGAQTPEAAVSIPTQGSTPTVVSDETSARVGAGNAQAAQDAANRAALASFGDVQLGNALMNTRYGQQQQQIGNFMRGSANVLGTELEAASHKGDGLRTVGGLLNAGGQLAGLGAAMGWNPFASAAAPAAAVTNPAMGTNVLTATKMTPDIALGKINYGWNPDPNWFNLVPKR